MSHASLLLLRIAAVELQLDLENPEWESLAGLELLPLPIANQVRCHLALHACAQSCSNGLSFTTVDLCPG